MFSPVVDFLAIRYFFALLILNCKWHNIQADVKAAYLYTPLSEEIYMQQSPEYEVEGKECWICKSHKALYGLYLSGWLWFYDYTIFY